jgi:hypothetical protein
MSTQPPEEIAAAVGSQSADVWSYVVIGIVVLAAVIYLARQFMPSRRKSGCSNCGSAGGCVAADLVRPKESDSKP